MTLIPNPIPNRQAQQPVTQNEESATASIGVTMAAGAGGALAVLAAAVVYTKASNQLLLSPLFAPPPRSAPLGSAPLGSGPL